MPLPRAMRWWSVYERAGGPLAGGSLLERVRGVAADGPKDRGQGDDPPDREDGGGLEEQVHGDSERHQKADRTDDRARGHRPTLPLDDERLRRPASQDGRAPAARAGDRGRAGAGGDGRGAARELRRRAAPRDGIRRRRPADRLRG